MNERPTYSGPEYPTKPHGSIPAFGSYEEEADFWDTHDLTDFASETVPVRVRATRGLSQSMQVRLDPDTDRELDQLARERGVKKSTLARMWLMERVKQEREQRTA